MSKRLHQRTENRKVAMQYLYSWDVSKPEILEDGLLSFFEQRDRDATEHPEEVVTRPRDYYAFAEKIIRGVVTHIEEIDAEIVRLAKNWTLKRIAKVDLAILRMSLYELMYCEDIPPVVTINEAVELGKIYSQEESKRFINGVLDRFKEGLTRPFRQAAGGSKGSGGDGVLDGLID